MSANLAEVRRTSALSKVINQIHKLEAIEQDVIALLPTLTDDQVIETRATARLLFASGWKIEIACDAEIWDRTQKALRGRGNVDVEEKGILAAVNKRADDIGCSARTVYENARIYRTFKENIESTCKNLDDKGFFQAALQSPQPQVAIESFAQTKMVNPHFRVSDAWKIVKGPKQGPKEDETKVAQLPEAQAWLAEVYAAVVPFIDTAPENAPFLNIMIRAVAGVILGQSDRTIEGDCRVIMDAIEENNGLSGDDLYDWQIAHFYFMGEDQLKDRLLLMVSNRELVEDDAGPSGRQAKRRGALPKWYVPYYTKRKKQEGFMCRKCDEWHRDPADCLEE